MEVEEEMVYIISAAAVGVMIIGAIFVDQVCGVMEAAEKLDMDI